MGRIAAPAAELLARVAARLDVTVSDTPFDRVTRYALGIDWTPDPFDG